MVHDNIIANTVKSVSETLTFLFSEDRFFSNVTSKYDNQREHKPSTLGLGFLRVLWRGCVYDAISNLAYNQTVDI